jgi:hypothetical protein
MPNIMRVLNLFNIDVTRIFVQFKSLDFKRFGFQFKKKLFSKIGSKNTVIRKANVTQICEHDKKLPIRKDTKIIILATNNEAINGTC